MCVLVYVVQLKLSGGREDCGAMVNFQFSQTITLRWPRIAVGNLRNISNKYLLSQVTDGPSVLAALETILAQ